MRQTQKTFLVWVILLLAFLLVWRLLGQTATEKPLAFSTLIEKIDRVEPGEEGEIKQGSLQIVVGNSNIAEYRGEWSSGGVFSSSGVFNETIQKKLEDAGVDYVFVKESEAASFSSF